MAAQCRRGSSRLAAVCERRPLGVDGRGLVLGVGLSVGLGGVSLWTLAQADAALGLVWSPDTTWGPAWVNWRHNDSYYGWAPLPPEARYESGQFSFHDKHVDVNLDFGLGERDYAFVPADHFLDVNLGLAVVSRSNAGTVYQQTTVINNAYVSNGSRVINNGVPLIQVEQRTHSHLETVRISDAHFAAGAARFAAEVHSRNGIVVFRPSLSNTAPRDPAAAIARGAYVRREVHYTHVTAERDRASENRLSSEIVRRSGAVATRKVEHAEPAVVHTDGKHDEASERRLESELAQREQASRERALPQTALVRPDAHSPVVAPAKGHEVEHASPPHEESAVKHADRNEHPDRDDEHGKKKHGHDD